MRKRHINEFLKSAFANSGRAAGMGIVEDQYTEESFPDPQGRLIRTGTPVGIKTVESESRKSGPVITSRIGSLEEEDKP